MVNRLKTLSKEFQKILKVTSLEAEALGLPIYLVGGVVRDLLLKKKILDLDIVVEGDAHSLAQGVAKRLECEFNRHHAFGTATVIVGIRKIDFATARVEHYSRFGALPKVCPASLEDDLFRRDFTINAMAISLNKEDYGRLIDLHEGLKDLKKGLLRVLHSRSFLDDPTRILRALRFEQRFLFRIEPHTLFLMMQSLEKRCFTTVSSHRIRDEIVLILSEMHPYRYIRRIDKLIGFSFLIHGLKLKDKHFNFFKRLERALKHYKLKHKKHRSQQAWLVYLAGMIVDIDNQMLARFFHDFAFRKGERLIIHSIKDNLNAVKKLNKKIMPSSVYKVLSQLSFEAILFFYAYYPLKQLRKNIDNFLHSYIHTNIKVKGKDLKAIGLKPEKLYGRIFQELLYRKLDKGLSSKKEEMRQALSIFERLSKVPSLGKTSKTSKIRQKHNRR